MSKVSKVSKESPLPPPEPVKIILAVLWREESAWQAVCDRFIQAWGEIDFSSPPLYFHHTDYYAPEMGSPLFRQIFSFAPLVSPEKLAGLKHFTCKIEAETAKDGNRQVNLDPGFVDYHKVVLASTKFGGKKIYLGEGIYADMVLYYAKGNWISLPWTFPDFKTGIYDPFLLEIRARYKITRRGEDS